MATDAPPPSQNWRGQVALASGCAGLGLLVRALGTGLPSPVAMIGLGAGLIGAAFLLAWAADAGEAELSGGFVVALVALIAVLPELTIEVQFAYTLQAEYVSANLTGATRLLLTGAMAMPVLGTWLLARRGRAAASFRISAARRVDLGVLLVASLYGIGIAARGRLTLVDGVLLIGLYLLYLRRVQGTEDEPPAVVGVSAGLAALPSRERRRWLAGLLSGAAIVVVAVAEPFTQALLATGTLVGIDPYLLIQSIVPLATEAPEFVVVGVLVLNHRPAQGFAILLASSVSQWTLALGSLPIAYLAGGGGTAMPLAGRELVELALTAATTLMAVAGLALLAPERIDAWIVLAAFAVQFAVPTVGVRLTVAIVLMVFAIDLLVSRRRAVPPMLAAIRSRPAARGSPGA